MRNLSVVFILYIICLKSNVMSDPDYYPDYDATVREIWRNKCPDCSAYLVQCNIKITGHEVKFNEDDQKIRKHFMHLNQDKTDPLYSCIRQDYKIVGLLDGYACFWSPELGCQKIIGRLEQERGFNETDCMDCLKHCPCDSRSTHLVVDIKIILICLGIIMKVNAAFNYILS